MEKELLLSSDSHFLPAHAENGIFYALKYVTDSVQIQSYAIVIFYFAALRYYLLISIKKTNNDQIQCNMDSMQGNV